MIVLHVNPLRNDEDAGAVESQEREDEELRVVVDEVEERERTEGEEGDDAVGVESVATDPPEDLLT